MPLFQRVRINDSREKAANFTRSDRWCGGCLDSLMSSSFGDEMGPQRVRAGLYSFSGHAAVVQGDLIVGLGAWLGICVWTVVTWAFLPFNHYSTKVRQFVFFGQRLFLQCYFLLHSLNFNAIFVSWLVVKRCFDFRSITIGSANGFCPVAGTCETPSRSSITNHNLYNKFQYKKP